MLLPAIKACDANCIEEMDEAWMRDILSSLDLPKKLTETVYVKWESLYATFTAEQRKMYDSKPKRSDIQSYPAWSLCNGISSCDRVVNIDWKSLPVSRKSFIAALNQKVKCSCDKSYQRLCLSTKKHKATLYTPGASAICTKCLHSGASTYLIVVRKFAIHCSAIHGIPLHAPLPSDALKMMPVLNTSYVAIHCLMSVLAHIPACHDAYQLFQLRGKQIIF